MLRAIAAARFAKSAEFPSEHARGTRNACSPGRGPQRSGGAHVRPKVIVHQAVSLDGRIDGFEPDVGLFYALASRFEEDLTLAGSETILAQAGPDADESAPIPPPARGDRRPLLAVVDSRGRVHGWGGLLASPYWRGGIALTSSSTPKIYGDRLKDRGLEVLTVGDERVDLRRALELLHRRHGIERVRVDSGGELSSVLLRAGLVDVISLLVHSVLAGPKARPFFRGEGSSIPLKVLGCEKVGEDKAWVRYEVPH